MRPRGGATVRAASGRIGVADNSGWTPDRTDDGVLWLDQGRPVRVGPKGCDFPLVRDSTGDKCWTCDPLLSGLRACEDLGLRIELSGDLGPALPLIVKLLDKRVLVA